MKPCLLSVTLLVFLNGFGQQANLLNLQSEFKLVQINPNVRTIERNSAYQVNTQVQSHHLNYCILHGKISWYAGLSYMKTNYVIPDRISHWNYILYTEDDFFNPIPYDTVYQVYQNPADYVARSVNWGINNEFIYHFKAIGKKEKLNHAVGIKHELYFLEAFKQSYEITDEVVNGESYVVGNNATPQAWPDYKTRKYSVYNTNLSAFYQLRWFPHDAFALGLRISAGTNLYSDWDKFKKYSWLSLGVELGFLTKKK